jgi:predicted nucleic acid-binding protein
MKTEKPKEYIAPVVKVVEVIVEKGFVISAIIYNNRLNKVEKHYLDEEQEW